MSTPVAHGRTKSPGGGEKQTATPRILAAEPGQRQRMDLETEVWRTEQRESEEAGASGRTERSDDDGTLAEGDGVGAATSEGAEQGGDKDEPIDGDWADWIAEEQRKANEALADAVLSMILRRQTGDALVHGATGQDTPRRRHLGSTQQAEKEPTNAEPVDDGWAEWIAWAAEEQRKDEDGDVRPHEPDVGSGGVASKARQGGPMWELEERLLNSLDGGRDWRRRPRSDWPPEQARGETKPGGRRFFSATDDPGLTEIERWQPGRCIAERDWGRVRDRPNTKVFRRGDTVAVTELGNPRLHRDSWRLPESSCTRYFVATVLEVDVQQRYYWDPNSNGILLDEGAGYHVHREYSWIREITLEDGTAWELDAPPMDVDTTLATEPRRGRLGNPETSYADSGTGIATSDRIPSEAAWSKVTHKDL